MTRLAESNLRLSLSKLDLQAYVYSYTVVTTSPINSRSSIDKFNRIGRDLSSCDHGFLEETLDDLLMRAINDGKDRSTAVLRSIVLGI